MKTRRYLEAQTLVEAFRQEYNNYRPHSSLDYLTPEEFAKRYYEKNQEKEAMQPRQVPSPAQTGHRQTGYEAPMVEHER